MDLCPHKITKYAESAGASRSHILSGKYTHIFPPHKVEDLLWGSYCLAHHSHPTITFPARCWASCHQRHHTPTWVQRREVLGRCLGSGPWETSLWASLAWPEPGAGRNSNKPIQANPRDIPLWRLILTLIWPNLCLFRDQQTLLATYQETLLRPASCWPPPPLSFRPHSVCISAPTQPENKSLRESDDCWWLNAMFSPDSPGMGLLNILLPKVLNPSKQLLLRKTQSHQHVREEHPSGTLSSTPFESHWNVYKLQIKPIF